MKNGNTPKTRLTHCLVIHLQMGLQGCHGKQQQDMWMMGSKGQNKWDQRGIKMWIYWIHPAFVPAIFPLGCLGHGWCPGSLPASEQGQSYRPGNPHKPSLGGRPPGGQPTNTHSHAQTHTQTHTDIDKRNVLLFDMEVNKNQSRQSGFICAQLLYKMDITNGYYNRPLTIGKFVWYSAK